MTRGVGVDRIQEQTEVHHTKTRVFMNLLAEGDYQKVFERITILNNILTIYLH